MVLYLDWPGFYAASCDAAKGDAPWAIAHQGHIRDANSPALAAGVTRGLTVNEAKAILPGLRPHPYSETEWLVDRDRWLAHAALASDVVAPGLPHQVWMDLRAHPRPLDVALEVLDSLTRAGTGPWRAGLAPCAWVAQLAAGFRDPPALWTSLDGPLVVHNAATFLADLPVDALTPLLPAQRERLRILGYDRVAGVQLAPFEALRMQFGRDAGRVRAAALGEPDQPLRGSWPPDACARSRRFPGGLDDLEALRHALLELARDLAQDLARRDSAAQHLDLDLLPEDGPPVRLSARLSTPTARALTWGLKFNQMVEAYLADLPEFVDGALPPSWSAVRACLTELKRTSTAAGRLAGMGSEDERAEQFDAAIAQLRPRYGAAVVQPLGQVTRPRRERVLRDWKEIYAWP